MRHIAIAALSVLLLAGCAFGQALEGADFNSIGNPPWPPSDSNGTKAPLGVIRIWDSGQKWGQIQALGSGHFNWTQMDNLVNNLVTNPSLAAPMAIEYTFGDTPTFASACSSFGDPSTCLPGPTVACNGTNVGQCGFGGGTKCASPSDYGCTPTSDIDSGTCTSANTTGCGLGTDAFFQTFVSTLANRYTTKIKYYGMSNEADSPNFWCQQGPPVACGGGNSNTTANTPALKRLIRMMWDANRITHCANPSRILLTPGFHVGTASTWAHQLMISSINAPAGNIGGCSWAAQTVTGAQAMEVQSGGPGYVNSHLRGAPSIHGCSAGGNTDPTNVICAYNELAAEITRDNLSTNAADDEYGYNGTAQAANTDIQAAYAGITNVLQNSFSAPPMKLLAWYTWDAGQGPLQGTIVGTAWNVMHGWTHNVTSRIGTCAITGTVYKCPGTTTLGVPFIIAFDSSKVCSPSCTTGSIAFGSQYSKYNDLAGVQHNTTGGNGTVPVGLKPVQVLQTAPALVLAVNGGNNQSGTVSTTLGTALSVLATSNGTPQAGVSVAFSDIGAGGSFSASPVTTNGSGIASTSYTLPGSAQTVTISGSSSGYSSATFTETATAAAHVLSISVSAGNGQTGNLSSLLPTPLSIVATDNGTPQAGVVITFSDSGAGGSFGTPTPTTDAFGAAATTYTLPSSAQVVTVSVSASGYTPATFTETAAAQVIAANSGNNQTGSTGTTLPTSLQALVTTNGTAVSGLSVTFTDGGAGGSFGSPTGITNSMGFVTTTYTLPATPQVVTVTAGSAGYTSGTFTETSATEALSAFGGNGQAGAISTQLVLPLTVMALINGVPTSGVVISFSDAAAGGAFGTSPCTTDITGTCSTTYTLPSTALSISITASSSGYSPAIFSETSFTPSPNNNMRATTGVRVTPGARIN